MPNTTYPQILKQFSINFKRHPIYELTMAVPVGTEV